MLKEGVMISVKYWLDKRRMKADGKYPLKMMLCQGSETRVLSVGVSLTAKQWDEQAQVVLGRAMGGTNIWLNSLRRNVEATIIDTSSLKRAVEAARLLASDRDGTMRTLGSLWDEYMAEPASSATKKRKATTRRTLSKLRDIDRMDVDDVTKGWVESLMRELDSKGLKRNTVSLYMSTLKTVIARAREKGLTNANPFSGIRLKSEPTRHRNLSVTALRMVRDKAGLTERQSYQRDMFMLSFYLIGMNPVDMYKSDKPVDGRLLYKRSKTGGLFDIKVEPEAEALIRKHKGSRRMLDISERYATKASWHVAMVKVLPSLCDNLTMYWARHTWATLAAELDVSIDVISAALGHKLGLRVTNIYVAVNKSKVDAANRLVLDYLASPYDDAASFLGSLAKQ